MQQQVTLRELENFVAVAENSSMTHGAAAVGISQPAMSGSIQSLERTLGVSLLVRHRGHGVSLTPEGAQLIAEAREVLSRAADITSFMFDSGSDSVGRVLLGSLVTVAPIVVPAMVREFTDRNPQIDVRLQTGTQDDLLAWLRSGEIHAAITYDIELGNDLDFLKLLDAEPHALLPTGHALATAETVSLEELADEPYVLLDLPISRQYLTSLFLAADVSLRPVARHTDLDLIRTLVGNGFGFSVVNLLPAAATAQDGSRLAYVKLRTSVKPVALGLVRRKGGTQSRRLEEFVQFALTYHVLPSRRPDAGNGSL
ncbi:MAG: LysR family transcriptional regulator [Acidimicrobiia bacterium]|nr:LysR family transcriptional regulator [Acidimicrobiia bacterium]